jgi:hypothetical protein
MLVIPFPASDPSCPAVPGIHDLKSRSKEGVDGRDKPGHESAITGIGMRAAMDLGKLQERIDAALINPETGRAWMHFSPYLSSVALDLQEKLERAAETGGLEALMDEFDRLRRSEDPHRLRVALATVLFHHPARIELGLRVP